MKHVYLHKNILGERKHVRVDLSSGTFEPVEDVDITKDWTLGFSNSLFDIEVLAALSGKLYDWTPGKQYKDAFNSLGCKVVKWSYAVQDSVFKCYIKRLLNDIRDIVMSDAMTYYNDVFVVSRVFLRALEGAYVDTERVYDYLMDEMNETNRSALNSMLPIEEATFAAVPTYEQLATATGRLTITAGPRIMTLPKKYRNVIKSRYGADGKIMMLDYKSLEPRVILHTMEVETPIDIYTHLNETMFDNKFDRAIVKNATIAMLYGASEQTIKNVTKMSGAELFNIVQGIKKYFKIDKLHDRLQTQLDDIGYITNMMGRKIFVEKHKHRKLVNYYAQSSAVDIALLGFANCKRYIDEQRLRVHPLFVIHDACMFDIHRDFIAYNKQLTDVASNVKGIDAIFYSSIEEVV